MDRFVGVPGDLDKPLLGLSETDFQRVADQVDVVVHNGAVVHWVYPYARLKGPNVLSTVECLRLASRSPTLSGVHFVSSTSVLDTAHYLKLGRVMEADSLDDAADGLTGGYGQTKWVAERMIRKAQAAGFPATVVRPGYVTGHSLTGVTNTDDFLCRMLKGCVEVGTRPALGTSLNMCPVDYVANASVAIALRPKSWGNVFHIANPLPCPFEDFLGQLAEYGWPVAEVPYPQWQKEVSDVAVRLGPRFALFPLLHLVLGDLPKESSSPIPDATNTAHALEGTAIRCPTVPEVMGTYLSYLVQVGFLPPPPPGAKRPLHVVGPDPVAPQLLTRTRN